MRKGKARTGCLLVAGGTGQIVLELAFQVQKPIFQRGTTQQGRR